MFLRIGEQVRLALKGSAQSQVRVFFCSRKCGQLIVDNLRGHEANESQAD
jgi:hypothetical protein